MANLSYGLYFGPLMASIRLNYGEPKHSAVLSLDRQGEKVPSVKRRDYNTHFNIDIKSADAIAPTIAAIMAAKAVGRVLVTSFSEARRLAAVRELPGVATSTGARRFASALASATFARSAALASTLREIDCVQVPTHYGPLRITTPRIIRRLHLAGVEIHVWTINDAVTMHRLLDLGIDGLVTDRADIAIAVLAERRRSHFPA